MVGTNATVSCRERHPATSRRNADTVFTLRIGEHGREVDSSAVTLVVPLWRKFQATTPRSPSSTVPLKYLDLAQVYTDPTGQTTKSSDTACLGSKIC